MPISRRRLAIGIACALCLAVLQLFHLNYLTGTGFLKRMQPARAFVSSNSCEELTCTVGNATEPGGFSGHPLLLELPSDAELVLPPLSMALPIRAGLFSEARCQIGHQGGAVLQLPKGYSRLAHVASHADEYLVPEGGLLRLPLSNEIRRNHFSASCTASAHGIQSSGYQNDSEAGSFAGRLIMQPHMRCMLPRGARLKVSTIRLHEENEMLGSTLTTEKTRQAPEIRPGHFCAKHRTTLRARRLALARSDGRGHAHWVATAAAVHLEAGSRSASATAFARWKRRKQMSSAHASTASTPTNGLVGSESESLPSLSVMFPLPSGRLKKDSTLATLRSLANQLQRLNNMPATNEIRGAKGTEENCGGMHASHSAGGRASICHEHVQLILLGSKPLCEESDGLVQFAIESPSVIHLSPDLSMANDTEGATAVHMAQTTIFLADTMLAWSLFAPSGVRMLADATSQLELGALHARVAMLRAYPQCDALFVPPGVMLHSTLRGGGARTHESKVDSDTELSVTTLRPWHMLDLMRVPNRSGTQAGAEGASWLEMSSVVAAKIFRGAWPVWQSSGMPSGCRLGQPIDSTSFLLNKKEHSARGTEPATKAELYFWLTCMQAGSVLCLASPRDSSSTLSPSSESKNPMDLVQVSNRLLVAVGAAEQAKPPAKLDTSPEKEAQASEATEESPVSLHGAVLEDFEFRQPLKTFQRIIIIMDRLPTQILSFVGLDGKGGVISGAAAESATRRLQDVLLVQVIAELAADGHEVTVVSRERAQSAEEVIALSNIGWKALCPACNSPLAAHCATCGEIQSDDFVRCRLQAAHRAPQRVRVIEGDAHLERATSVPVDVAILVVSMGAKRCGSTSAAELAIEHFTASAHYNQSSALGTPLAGFAGMPHRIAVADHVPTAPLLYGHGGTTTRRFSNHPGAVNGRAMDVENTSCNETSVLARHHAVFTATSLVLTLTDEDRSAITRLRPGVGAQTIPLAMTSPLSVDLATSFEDRLPLVLFAAPARPSHRRALRWMLRHVWPLVRAAVPGAPLALAGANAWRLEVKRAAENGLGGVLFLEDGTLPTLPNIAKKFGADVTFQLTEAQIVRNVAEDGGSVSEYEHLSLCAASMGLPSSTASALSSTFSGTKPALLHRALRRARVVASPILASQLFPPSEGDDASGSGGRSGADFPTSAFLALAHGIPLVTTPLGARGLLSTRTDGAIAVTRSSTDFALAFIALLSNSSAWMAQRNAAAVHVERYFGHRRLQRAMRRALWEVNQRASSA